jgi:hypothetical protein
VAQSGLALDLGLVQTAYANGSSTKYITDTLVRSHLLMVSDPYPCELLINGEILLLST